MKRIIAANLFRGIESVGGKLHFNEREMVFESHALNVQTGDAVIVYTDVASVTKRNTLGFVPNGILVTLKNNIEYKFVIWNRNEIISFIETKLKIDRETV